MPDIVIEEALTFDDVILSPGYSEVIPNEVDVSASLTKRVRLNIPIISAAMDTVTEFRTSIAMAQEGGIGVIHRNLSIPAQVGEVEKVKKYESGMIVNPLTVGLNTRVRQALDIMLENNISGLPILRSDKTLYGIVTNRDIRFEKNMDLEIDKIMTPREKLVTVKEGTTIAEAKDILHKFKIEKLPVVDDKFKLRGLITMKDIEKIEKFPKSSKDAMGRLLVGAAVGVDRNSMDRVDELVAVGCDVIVVDTAHGHSKRVIDQVAAVRKKYDVNLVVGNIATAEAAEALIKTGADCLKVGVGPGSICTTRVIAGIGMPQITAITNVCSVAKKRGIPVIADGGIKYSGDITKALAAGADSVMIGNLLAGSDEAPGEVVLYQGRTYKVYRGMGSIEAMRFGSRDRYAQDDEMREEAKLVPEGIEGRVPYRGNIGAIIYQLVGGLRAGMGYTGSLTVKDLQRNAKFIKITNAGLQESHVHDIVITKESPNYRIG